MRYVALIQEHNERCAPGQHINSASLLRRIDQAEIVPFIKFWVVLAFVNLFDAYVEVFVSWIPFYSVVKGAFLVYIIAPQSNGAAVVYDRLVAPQLQKRMQWIEEVLAPAIRRFLLQAAHHALRFTLDHAQGAVSSRELKDMERSIESLLRDVTREGYVRRREETIEVLKDSLGGSAQLSQALLDDILREYPDEDDAMAWTQLSAESFADGSLRLRAMDAGYSDDDDKPPKEFVLAEYLQYQKLLASSAARRESEASAVSQHQPRE